MKKIQMEILEKTHREGYRKYPVTEGEFDIWEPEQIWGDQFIKGTQNEIRPHNIRS